MFVQKTLKLPVAHVIAAKLLGVEPLHLLFFLLLSPWLGTVYIFLAIPMQNRRTNGSSGPSNAPNTPLGCGPGGLVRRLCINIAQKMSLMLHYGGGDGRGYYMPPLPPRYLELPPALLCIYETHVLYCYILWLLGLYVM